MKTQKTGRAIAGVRSKLKSFALESCEPRVLLSAFTVNTISDLVNPGVGLLTLRQAVADANAHVGADTIAFDPKVFTPNSLHTITLTQGQIDFTDTTGSTTILGPGSSVVAVSGNRASRVFHVHTGVSVSITGLTITDGMEAVADPNGNTYGGGILSTGSLTLINSTLSGNDVNASAFAPNGFLGNGLGGAIYSGGALTISGSTLSNNIVAVIVQSTENSGDPGLETAFGGAIFSTGNVQITNSLVTGNMAQGYGLQDKSEYFVSGPAEGGGLWSSGVTTIASSVFSGNTATAGRPGGFDGEGANASGGGLWAGNALTVSSSTISGNQALASGSGYPSNISGIASGGGIFAATTLNLSNSTIHGNTALGGTTDVEVESSPPYGPGVTVGGGVDAIGAAALIADTVSNNTAIGGPGNGAAGGGVYGANSLSIQSSTISGNTVIAKLSEQTSEYHPGGNAIGGGVATAGRTSITDSTVSGNSVTGGYGYTSNGTYNPSHGGNGQGSRKTAGDWRWGSCFVRQTKSRVLQPLLADWPIDRPRNWQRLVDEPQTTAEEAAILQHLRRGRPCGSLTWMQSVVKKLGLEQTMRPRGRPMGWRKVTKMR